MVPWASAMTSESVVWLDSHSGKAPGRAYVAAHVDHAATANQYGFSGLDLQFGIVIFAQCWVP